MKKIFKLFLIGTFFSYYIIAIALNYPWIDSKIKPLEFFYNTKIKEVKRGIYFGLYPDYKDLKYYKDSLNINQVVTILNPNFPFSRELVKAEEQNCKKLGLDFIIIPIESDSKSPMDFIIIQNFVQNQKHTLINSYYFDKRMDMLEKILKRG